MECCTCRAGSKAPCTGSMTPVRTSRCLGPWCCVRDRVRPGRMDVRGDRSGTIFRVRDGRATPFATIPPSVAAFHLAMSAEQELFVTAPTLNPSDCIYPGSTGRATSARCRHCSGGRRDWPSPPTGRCMSSMHWPARAACTGSATPRRPRNWWYPEARSVGVAFGPHGEMAVVSNETAYRFD